jgi:phosphotransferase system enzyme I (PtsP)
VTDSPVKPCNATETENSLSEIIFEGDVLSHGMAIGKAEFFQAVERGHSPCPLAIDIDKEKSYIKESIEKLRENINEILAETAVILTEESLEIFDVYRMLVQDVVFERELIKLIESGKSAYEATEEMARMFRRKLRSEPFWQTRLYDMQYLLRQLREFLPENEKKIPTQEFQEVFKKKHPVILIAPYVSPADLLYYYKHRRVVGLVFKDSGATSHAAIVARSLRIPTIGGIYLTQKQCAAGTQVLVNAYSGHVYVHPSSQTLSRLQTKNAYIKSKQDDIPLQSITKDKIKIDLYLNANLDIDLPLLSHPIINGVGLFRTEILFMLPDIAFDFFAQAEEYRKVFDRAGDKPVVFRTVDISDDKDFTIIDERPLPKRRPEPQKDLLKDPIKSSQHLGSGTSLGKTLLNRYELLHTQIRALLRARLHSKNPYGDIHIMIPMISDVVELKVYQRIIESEALRETQKFPSLASQIKIGIMVEVPALIYQIKRFHSLVDFVSIGTNDLFQFFFAANRWNGQGRRSKDMLSPAFLLFIGNIVHQLMHLGIPIHVCGEMASDPLTAMALLGMGVRKLSLAPSAVGNISRMINSLNLGFLYPYMRHFRVEPREFCVTIDHKYRDSIDVRYTLQNFAMEHHVEV